MSDIADRFKKLAVEELGVDLGKIVPSANLFDDLGADSLDFVKLAIAAEAEFDCKLTDNDLDQIKTVGEFIALIQKETAA